jgi:hypothetical protein
VFQRITLYLAATAVVVHGRRPIQMGSSTASSEELNCFQIASNWRAVASPGSRSGQHHDSTLAASACRPGCPWHRTQLVASHFAYAVHNWCSTPAVRRASTVCENQAEL